MTRTRWAVECLIRFALVALIAWTVSSVSLWWHVRGLEDGCHNAGMSAITVQAGDETGVYSIGYDEPTSPTVKVTETTVFCVNTGVVYQAQ